MSDELAQKDKEIARLWECIHIAQEEVAKYKVVLEALGAAKCKRDPTGYCLRSCTLVTRCLYRRPPG